MVLPSGSASMRFAFTVIIYCLYHFPPQKCDFNILLRLCLEMELQNLTHRGFLAPVFLHLQIKEELGVLGLMLLIPCWSACSTIIVMYK